MQKLHAEFTQFKSLANGSESTLLFWIQRVGRWCVARVERIFGGIERFLPALELSFAQHSFQHCSRNSRQFHQSRQRQWTRVRRLVIFFNRLNCWSRSRRTSSGGALLFLFPAGRLQLLVAAFPGGARAIIFCMRRLRFCISWRISTRPRRWSLSRSGRVTPARSAACSGRSLASRSF